MPLNVGIYLASLEPSGISRFAANLADGLCARGHRVTTIADSDAAERLAFEHTAVLGAQSTAARVLRLRQVAKRLRLNAIISNGYYADLISVLAFPFGSGPKLVSVSHSRPALWATDQAKGSKRLAAQLAVRAAHRSVDEVVAVSRGLAVELEERAWSGRPYKVIYNPVINPFILSHERNIPRRPNDLRIASMGWISPQKGLHVVLDALKVLQARLPDHAIALDVIGGVPAGCVPYREQLEDFARRNNQCVRFHGVLSNPYPLLANADVCVTASLSEALPTVLIEAMGLGVPVVSSDCPHGPSEILNHGRCGLLFPVNDSGALSDHLERLACDQTQRLELAAAGKARARDFDRERAAAEYEALIDKPVKRSRPR